MTNKKEKTTIIRTHTKQLYNHHYICSKCFAEIDVRDEYCWSCGEKLATDVADDFAYRMEDLIEREVKL